MQCAPVSVFTLIDLPAAKEKQRTPSKSRAATREAMSSFLRRFAAAWLLERVSSGVRRQCLEEESYRCIYTGGPEKLKVFSGIIDWKWGSLARGGMITA